MNTSFQKGLLWLSQYQITLILITAASIAAGGWLVLEEVRIIGEGPSIPWHFYTPLTLIQNSWIAETLVLLFSVFLVVHLLCLAWVRTARNLSNAPLIAFLTLLSIYLPAAILNHCFTQRYQSNAEIGKLHYYLESIEQMEVVLITDLPEIDRFGVFAVPFESLEENHPISHPKWGFSLMPETIINYAGIGGPLSRLRDSKGNELRGIQATKGISNDAGLRLYKVTPTPETGKGLIVRVLTNTEEKKVSYLLYGSNETGKGLPAQALEDSPSEISISLMPQRIYPGFSWKVERSHRKQWLVMLDANGKEETGRFPLGLKSHPTVAGYTFSSQIPSEIEFNPNSVQIKITRAALPFPYKGFRILMILTLVVFLTNRTFQEGLRSIKRRVQA